MLDSINFGPWLEPFRHDFMLRALYGCAIIGFLNGFLGAFIVLRRLALMVDALSHSLLPGLAVGVLLFGVAPLGLFFGALAAALFVTIGSQLISRNSRIKEDTSLGILYTVAFSIGVLLLNKVHSPISLHHYLFGNILGLSSSDLWMNYGILLVVIPIVVALQRPLLLCLFDPVVAKSQGIRVEALNYLLMGMLVLTMISTLQAVGVVLALGLLVAPAATVYLLSDSVNKMFWGGGFLGALGSCCGLLLSYWFDLETGPCIVLLLGSLFLLAYLFGPRYGLLAKFVKRRHFHHESLQRWDEPKPVAAKDAATALLAVPEPPRPRKKAAPAARKPRRASPIAEPPVPVGNAETLPPLVEATEPAETLPPMVEAEEPTETPPPSLESKEPAAAEETPPPPIEIAAPADEPPPPAAPEEKPNMESEEVSKAEADSADPAPTIESPEAPLYGPPEAELAISSEAPPP